MLNEAGRGRYQLASLPSAAFGPEAPRERDGVLDVNPGSAGPRRFRLPVSVALLEADGGRVRARIELLHLPPRVEP